LLFLRHNNTQQGCHGSCDNHQLQSPVCQSSLIQLSHCRYKVCNRNGSYSAFALLWRHH
jgi:hypothetical protein